MISAAFTVNGASNPAAHAVDYESTVNLALTSYNGGISVIWSIISCSDPDEPIPTIVESGTPPGRTASFVMPVDSGDTFGRTFLVKCVISTQIAGSGGAIEQAVEYAVIGATNSKGLLPIAPGEENYRHGTHGWSPEVNIALNNTSAGGTGDVTGAASSANNDFALFSGTSGKSLKTSGFGPTTVIRTTGANAFTADQSMGSHKLTSLSDGTNAGDAVNKGQLDSALAGVVSTVTDWKQSVRAATTANITLSAPQTIDGVSVIAGNRVLVKNQSTASQNGIYVVAAGSWTRATDADVDSEVTTGLTTVVEEGSTNGGKPFILTTANPIVVGTTSLSFSAISTVTAGNGLTGTATLSVVADGSTLSVSSSGVKVATNGITSNELATGSVTTAKLNTSGATAGQAIVYSGSAWAYSTDFVAQNLTSTGYFGGKDNAAIGGTGDAALFRAGDATGASGTRTGGNLVVRSGTGATASGNVTIQRGSANVLASTASSTTVGESTLSDIVLGSSASLRLNGNVMMTWGSTIQIVQSAGILEYANGLTPVFRQIATSASAVTGGAFLINSQDASGTGSSGGSMTLRAGDASGASGTRNGGVLTLRSGTGASGDGDVFVQRGSSASGLTINASSTFLEHTNTLVLRINGTTTHVVSSANIQSYVRDFMWNENVSTPRLYQKATTTTTGQLLSVIGQETNAIGGTGGALSIQAGDATGASGTRTGGALTIRSGTGATANGTIQLLAGTLNVIEYGIGTSTALTVGDALLSEAWYRVASGGTHRFRYGSNQLAAMNSTTFELTAPSLVQWAKGVSDPSILHESDNSTSSGTGKTLTIAAQDMSLTGGVTGGTLALRAGNATGASGSRTGGTVTITSGTGATANGNIILTATGSAITASTATINLNATGTVNLGTSAGIGVQIKPAQLVFDSSATSPIFTQVASAAASGTAQAMIISSQDAAGTTSVTGGLLTVKGGDATGLSGTRNGGGLNLRPGNGANSGGTLDIQSGAGTSRVKVNDTGIGFFAATPVAKPTVTGSKSANAALTSLLTGLAALGLITDSSS